MAHNNEFFMIDWFNLSLVEKCCHIHHSDETGISHLKYYISLDLHQIGILFYNDIKNADVNNWIVFLHFLTVFFNDFLNNKDRKAVFSSFTCSLQLFLFMKFVKFLIYYSFILWTEQIYFYCWWFQTWKHIYEHSLFF